MNIFQVELNNELLYDAYQKDDDKTINENISFKVFENFLQELKFDKKIKKESPIYESDEAFYREKLFDLNHVKVNGHYIHLIEVNNIGPEEISIDKKLLDNDIKSNYYVPIFINESTGNAFILGYFNFEDIEDNIETYDNHFYKIESTYLKPIEAIIEELNIEKIETNKNFIIEDESEISDLLINQINNLNQFNEEEFISEIDYLPEKFFKVLLESEFCAELYLKAQEIFINANFLKSNMLWETVLKIYDLIKNKYSIEQDDKNIVNNRLNEIFKEINHINHIKDLEINSFFDLFDDLDKVYKEGYIKLEEDIRIDIIETLKSLPDNNKSNHKIQEIKEALLESRNNFMKMFNFKEIDVEKIMNRTDFSEIDISFVKNLINNIVENSLIGLLKFENIISIDINEQYFHEIKKIISINNDYKSLGCSIALALYSFSKSGKFNLIKNCSKKEIALIVDIGLFTSKELVDLKDKNLSLKSFEINLIKKNISSFNYLLADNGSHLDFKLNQLPAISIEMLFGTSGMLIELLLGSLIGDYSSGYVENILSEENINKIKAKHMNFVKQATQVKQNNNKQTNQNN